eukprot:Em0013g614a
MAETGKILFPVTAVTELQDAQTQWDTLVIVLNSVENLPGSFGAIKSALETMQKVDNAFSSKVSLVPFEGKRLIVSPTGPLSRDQDDVRRCSDAAQAGVKRALSAGAKCLCLVAAPELKVFEEYQLVTLLAALGALYMPLEVREWNIKNGKSCVKVSSFLFWCDNEKDGEKIVSHACNIENGRIVARDIGGGDPEWMAAPRAAEYILATFSSTVKVKVYSGHAELEKRFPLLAAVNRCAQHVPRHDARVVKLHYKGEGEIKRILYFVGKGITYDTGGADIKTGGLMAGMYTDKCGAATVAGLFKILETVKPEDIEVVGWLALVRNSVGSDCYVSDEVIASRAGVRVRVVNTDAEGRMVMADLLCRAKESALKPKNYKYCPHIFTIATLTGHVIRTYGPNYTAVLDNGPARKISFAQSLQTAGDIMGDPLEISNIRREDYEIVAPLSEYEDVLQSNTSASSPSPRGHQFPAAFHLIASGLDKHGIDSSTPVAYTHLDIAGSGGGHPNFPTGAPIPALVHQLIG